MDSAYQVNTLHLKSEDCSGCGMCIQVCPHAVFERQNGRVVIVSSAACMECGACQKNCPTGAVQVDSGVGCATAMILAALRGTQEVTCA